MIDAERRAAIEELIATYTKTHGATKQSARAALIREGLYTEDGELSPEFGGKDNRAPKSAA